MKRTRFVTAIAFAFLSAAPLMSQDETRVDPPAGTGPVFVVPIHGEINQSLLVFVRRATERAKGEGAGVVVFDIDTFGGRVDSALKITTTIGSLSEIPTIAYVTVRPEGTGVSWSAGALISLACDAIYMAPGTSMGSAAPIIQSPDGAATPADEKTVSAVRTQMAALAEKNGYPMAIARAMVDSDIELLEAYVDGEITIIASDEQEFAAREAEDAGKTFEVGRTISAAGKLANLTAGEMERYGVSSGTVTTLDDLLSQVGVAGRDVVSLEPSSADELVTVLTGTGLTSLLILVGLVALFIEITSPGFGVPGTIGILCFAVIFVTNGLLGRVASLELLLFLLGTVLLVVEIFVIPGFGVTGIVGLALMAAGLILSLQTFVIPTFEWEWRSFHRNVLVVVGNALGALITIGVLAHFIPRFRLFSRLVLSESQMAIDGFTAQEPTMEESYLGKKGAATTTLRPAGKANLDGSIIPVESEGEFIESGSPVEVIAVNGNRIVVRRLE